MIWDSVWLKTHEISQSNKQALWAPVIHDSSRLIAAFETWEHLSCSGYLSTTRCGRAAFTFSREGRLTVNILIQSRTNTLWYIEFITNCLYALGER